MDNAPSNPRDAMIPSKAETKLLETKSPLLHTHERTLFEPVVEDVSGGHERHCVMDEALYVGENVLIGQLVHTDEAVAAKEPALQAAHVMSLIAPSTGEAVPEGQLVQSPLSGDEKVPVLHMSTKSSCSVID
jgi:hypothetical protein